MPADDQPPAETPAPARKAPAPPAPEPPPQPPPAPPHFYVAAEDLYVHNPEAAVAPARAFTAGQLVPAELVEPNGWQDQVRPQP
jgi:hypothetical protein